VRSNANANANTNSDFHPDANIYAKRDTYFNSVRASCG
jgi:hypothetical protein